MGLFPGGQTALHDHTSSGAGGALGLSVVGTGQLRTATGSSAFAVETDVTMNDYAFNASETNSASLSWLKRPSGNVADPNNTVARTMYSPNGGGGTTTVRWRYATASDKPEIWIVADPITKAIVAVWCSDDPPAGGRPGVQAFNEIGHVEIAPPVKINLADLAALNLPANALLLADAYIFANRLDPGNRLYRALQEHARDSAPALWILNNCRLDAQGKLSLTPTGQAEIAVPEPPETLPLLQRIWQGILSWFTP